MLFPAHGTQPLTWVHLNEGRTQSRRFASDSHLLSFTEDAGPFQLRGSLDAHPGWFELDAEWELLASGGISRLLKTAALAEFSSTAAQAAL